MKSTKSSETSSRNGSTNLDGYGYTAADQDGFDGEEISPTRHKEEEFFGAMKEMLDVKPLKKPGLDLFETYGHLLPDSLLDLKKDPKKGSV